MAPSTERAREGANPAVGPTTHSDEVHGEERPAGVPTGTEMPTAAGVPVAPVGGEGAEAAGRTQDPPAPTGQAAPLDVQPVEMGLGGPVRPQCRPRRLPPRKAAVEVEKIERGPAQPADAAPQVFRTVLRCEDEFDMLEEEVVSEGLTCKP